MRKSLLTGILLFAAILSGCGGGGGGGGTPPAGSGTVTGTVYAPDNKTPIVGAQVTAQASRGAAPTATTDSKGEYTLTGVPAGAQTIVATKGSYQAQITVTVAADQTVAANPLALEPTGKIGLFEGVYDDIGAIFDQLEISFEVIDSDTVQDSETLSEYAAIFFACDAVPAFTNPDNETYAICRTNLENFVNQGGSIYASDISFEVIDWLFPEKITRATVDADGQTIQAEIVDPEMQAVLGKNTAAIHFDIGGWVVIGSVAQDVTVDLEGDVVCEDGATIEDVPLMVHFSHGGGRVVFTSFHNEKQNQDLVTVDTIKLLKHLVFNL